jgi:phosphoglucosamine mutase
MLTKSDILHNLNPMVKTPLFGTDGIRGKAGDLLNSTLGLQVGYWGGKVLQEFTPHHKTVIIGQDSRNSSDMLAMALSTGLLSAGLEVWNVGLCPTPCVAYLTRTTDAIGGVMISASHNPPEDNGIKLFNAQGLKLQKEGTVKIESALQETSEIKENIGYGKYYHHSSLVENYLQFLHQTLPSNLDFRGLKIVLDLAWGACVNTAPEIFKALGAQVICLHDQPNGDRINVNCGSTHLQVLQEAIKEHDADLGFAFDGDADRVMAVDAQGRIVDGDYILYLWGKTLKEQEQLPDNLIVSTVMANLGFERAWEKLGGNLIRTSVGDQYVQSEMWKTGAMLGGEQSGHILCHHHGFSGDGVQTALHLTALVQKSGLSLTELLAQSFTPYPQKLQNIRVEDRHRRLNWQNCDPVQIAIDQAQKALGNQGRILVRASGTEPLIRVMVEAINHDLVNYWTGKLCNVVESHLA